jgi:hypothetical protein
MPARAAGASGQTRFLMSKVSTLHRPPGWRFADWTAREPRSRRAISWPGCGRGRQPPHSVSDGAAARFDTMFSTLASCEVGGPLSLDGPERFKQLAQERGNE